MKVLIISVNALGDTYLSCSVLSPIVKHFQKSEINFVANENSKFFLDKFELNNVLYLKSKSLNEIAKIFFILKKVKYDLVFSFFPGRVNSFLFLGSISKVKAGFVNIKKKKEWYNNTQRLFLKGAEKLKEKHFWKPNMNFLERIEMCLSASGVVVNQLNKPRFSFDKLITENFYNDVVVHFASRRSDKNIRNQELIKLIKYLSIEKNLKVGLVGIKEDFANVEDLRNVKTIKFYCNPSIEELITLLLDTKLFIGVDSFPIHLADAYNIKTIGIFGNTNPECVFQSMTNKYIVKNKTVSDINYRDVLDVFDTAMSY